VNWGEKGKSSARLARKKFKAKRTIRIVHGGPLQFRPMGRREEKNSIRKAQKDGERTAKAGKEGFQRADRYGRGNKQTKATPKEDKKATAPSLQGGRGKSIRGRGRRKKPEM